MTQTQAVAHGRKRLHAQVDEPVREEVREPTRKVVAHGRTRKRKGIVDQFHIPAELIPEGWDYQWCRKSVWGQPDVAHQIGLQENGWTNVPSERHQGMFMPPDYKGEIERGGLVLMERPVELTQEARAEEAKAAKTLVDAQREQLGLAMPRSFTTDHPDLRNGIRTSYEPGVPQGRHQLAMDN